MARKQTLTKDFTYKDHKFSITIELYVKQERSINGKRWHFISIQNEDKSFFKEEEFESDMLNIKLIEYKTIPIQWVDKLNKTEEELIIEDLINQGFTLK